jgi:hypothetical protein
VPTETKEQKTIVSHIRKNGFVDPLTEWMHIRNEQATDWARIEAKKMGIKKKIPDFHFLRLGNRGWIELKKRGWKETKSRTGNYNEHEIGQLEMHDRLRANGDWVEICETLDEVRTALFAHGMPLRSESISTERIRRGFQSAADETEAI